MKILFIVPYVPSPIRIRSYNLIKSLFSLGHHITVITAISSEDENEYIENLRGRGIEVVAESLSPQRSLLNCMAALATNAPLQAVYSWSPTLAQRISELAFDSGVNQFDVIHVEHLRGSRYALFLKSQMELKGIEIPIVWDSVDCISLLFRQASVQGRNWYSRLMTRFELQRTEKYEAYLLRQFRFTLVTSPIDRKSMLSLLPRGETESHHVLTIPNGVDLRHFYPIGDRQREPATLVVSGKMSYHANVAMVAYLLEDIMPLVWEHRPDVKVMVVGKDPPSKIRDFSRNPRIRVTGTVDDIRPYLLSGTLAVAPVVYGAGIQNKILEAMACGIPVVATPTAIRALQVEPGQDLLVSEKPSDFAEAIIRLLQNPYLREAFSHAGRVYVEKNCQWKRIAEQLADTYRLAVIEKSRKYPKDKLN